MQRNICKNPHRYNKSFKHLSDNQGKIGRHKCAGCAYELGRHHALIGVPKAKNDSVLICISDSQAGAVRHKNAFEAYNHGYNTTLNIVMKKTT